MENPVKGMRENHGLKGKMYVCRSMSADVFTTVLRCLPIKAKESPENSQTNPFKLEAISYRCFPN